MNVWELFGFVCYKIGTIFQIPLATGKARAFIPLKKLWMNENNKQLFFDLRLYNKVTWFHKIFSLDTKLI
jgi:hypothetical protein